MTEMVNASRARKKSMRSRGALAALATVGLVAVSACGSSSSGGSPSAASTSSSTSSGSFTLSSPLTLGFLWEVKGEGAYGIDDYQDGALLALQQINAAGGVGGQPVKDFRVATDPTNLQSTVASFLQAADKNPSVLLGMAAPSQVEAITSQLDRAQIPLLATTTADLQFAHGGQSGSDYLWPIGASDPETVSAGIDYLVNTLHLKKIGVMGTNESFGNAAVASAKAALSALGLKPYAVAQYSPTATDLTQQVLDMKGADAVLDWGYPNPLAVQLKQFAQNGIDIPTMSGTGIEVAIQSNLVPKSELGNLYVNEPCNPNAPASSAMESFVAAYKAKYGSVPTQNAAYSYDAVKVAVAAVEQAKSADPKAINAALKTVSVQGACSDYHADGAQFLAHSAQITKYSSTAAPTVVKRITLAPTADQS
ncbi:MAG TPA: ABC transporter substrate-binding protein [Mycobacteriales bacterium]|nr:ABC transporter substrate-binding protein [Mycobacteriales bacterium]